MKCKNLALVIFFWSASFGAHAESGEVQTTNGCRAIVNGPDPTTKYTWTGKCSAGLISSKGRFTEYYSDGRIWAEIDGTAKSGSIDGYARIIYGGNPRWYFNGIVENTTGKLKGKEKVRDDYLLEGTFINGTIGRGRWSNLQKGVPVEIVDGTWDGQSSFSGFATKKIRHDICVNSCTNGYREGDWYVISGIWENGALVKSCPSKKACQAEEKREKDASQSKQSINNEGDRRASIKLTDWEDVGYAKGRWSVRCDGGNSDGSFLGFVGLDGDGYYHGDTVDKSLENAVGYMIKSCN